MKAPPAIALAVLAAALPVMAADGAFDPRDIEGRYSYRFQNGLVDGERYTSENILEIVSLGPTQAYVRADLEFFNGHMCNISGVARVEGRALVYRPTEPPYVDDPPCVLHVLRHGDKVRLQDDGTCRQYCGARGTLHEIDFPAKSRRVIRYMARLKASSEFKGAIEESLRAPRPAPVRN